MRSILLFVLLTNGILAFSQTISKQVIGPGGQTFETGTYKLSYTTGEVAIGTMSSEDGTIQLGNGYYPSLDLSTLHTETLDLQLQLRVFPNPTKEVIYITHPTESFFEVRITDVSGKQILKTAHQKQQPLSIQTLTTGTYFITVSTIDSKHTNTYKIIKQ
jgi:hypothetical protein